MDANDLLAVLRSHYIAQTTAPGARDGGVFAPEVAMNGSWGGPGTRRADALYSGFTAASGRILIGHEIKVSRADWRNELTKVGKADAWADACHAWYIVAPSTDVAPPEELPNGWGLMLPPRSSRGRRMQIAIKASVKTDHDPPWWAVRSLMARLETLEHQTRADEVSRIVKARVEEERARFEARAKRQEVDHELQSRVSALETLERSLGVTITSWGTDLDADRVSAQTVARGMRIAALLERDANALGHLGRFVDDLARATDGLRETLPQVRALAEGHDPAARKAS